MPPFSALRAPRAVPQNHWRKPVVWGLLLCCLGSALLLSACMGPPALHRAVLGYDEIVSRLESEMLLLNIARSEADLPPHFTAAVAVAATFNWTVAGGVLGIFRGGTDPNQVGQFNLGASASENPTFSIVPVTGREFTERILTPLPDGVFDFLIFQGLRLDKVMRLMGGGIELQKPDGSFDRFVLNNPGVREEYEEFRRIAMHLKWLNDIRRLFVTTIVFEETLAQRPADNPPTTSEITEAIGKKLTWRRRRNGTHVLKREVTGRVAVTNYDLDTVPNEERRELNDLAHKNPSNFALLHLKAGHPGGDWPMFGGIKLRSFHSILEFVADGISKRPEYDVQKDPRTGDVHENPRSVLEILVTKSPPDDEKRSVYFRGKYYSIGNTGWDRRTFIILSLIYQSTLTDLRGFGIPITISK